MVSKTSVDRPIVSDWVSASTGMFERFRVLLLGAEGKMTPGKAFMIGALSKTLATVVRAAFHLVP